MKRKIVYTIFTVSIILLILLAVNILKPTSNNSSILGGDVYASTVKEINSNMDKLMIDINKEMEEKPERALLGCPIDFIRGCNSYQNIIKEGLKGVKPLYDKLYESRDAGLYEYILSMAIQDITKDEYIYNVTYGRKNSFEFRLSFEAKVNNAQTNVERIINNSKTSDEEKVLSLSKLGILTINPLIKEYKNEKSVVSKDVISKSIYNIITKYNSDNVNKLNISEENIDTFIEENEELFNSMSQLRGRAYNN